MERLVRKSTGGHTKLAFREAGVSGIVVKDCRPSQFGRLPSGSPTLPSRSLPLRICIIDVVAPFANRFLTISRCGFNSRADSRGLQDPNEAFLCFVGRINMGNLSEGLDLGQCLWMNCASWIVTNTPFIDRLCLTLFCHPLKAGSLALSVFRAIHS